MIRDLIVNATNTGVEIALLEDQLLVELHHEKYNNNFAVGDIFIAKVKKTVSGLNAAFVDIGFDKDAFLHYTDLGAQVRSQKKYMDLGIAGKLNTHLLDHFSLEKDIDKGGKISDVLSRRDIVLAQILKEPISSKGPRLSCEVTLAGHFVVLTPFGSHIAISRKIKSSEERKRLQRLVESIKPAKFGIIVRTAAANKTVAELHEDINAQVDKWRNILSQLNKVEAPDKVLSEAGKTSSIIRDLLHTNINQIVVNDKGLADDIKLYAKELSAGTEKMVAYYGGRSPVFDQYKITKQIKASFGETVSLASGAHLVIEHTEAMHVIDVNSGHKVSTRTDQETNALTINLEAAIAISRQLRLRDIGGLIVIDFIDFKNADNKQMLFRRMKELMLHDRATHTILPLSKFCLMQITRERMRPEVSISTEEICPSCKGSGKVNSTLVIVDEIENNLGYLLNELDYQQLKIVVHPFVEAYFKRGIISRQWKLFWKYKKWVSISSDNNYHLTEFHFYNNESEEIKL